MPRLKIALVAVELVNAWFSLGKLLGWLLLPALLVSTGCTIKTGSGPLATTKRPGYRVNPLDVAPPPAPAPAPLPDHVVQMLAAHNERRDEPLALDATLGRVAQDYADWMAEHRRLGHQGEGGSWPWDRVKAAGYEFSICAENVAGDFSFAASAFNGWMQSPGHRRNALNDDYTHAGFGLGVDAGGRNYWCAVYARPS